ncbi:MAG: mechanosensitive ion channel family protein [Candidatus Binataceae bacterium]
MIAGRLIEQIESFEMKHLGVVLGAWLIFAIISILVFVALLWVRRILSGRLSVLAARTTSTLDDLLVKLVRATNSLFLLVVALYIGSFGLPLKPHTWSIVGAIAAVALLFQAGLWGNRVTGHVIARMAQREDATTDHNLLTALGALGFLARVALWSAVVLVMLSSLHINITALVAGLGVGGIAVALAVQSVLGDLFASLSIILDKPFAVGHFITVDNLAGTVEHVGIKSTRIRSLSGEEIVLSNGDLLKSRIHNYRTLNERRVVFSFGVTYNTSYESLVRISATVREIIEHLSKTRFDRAHFKEYGDSALNFEVVYYVLDPDYTIYMDIQQAINLSLFQRFAQARIEFAYPTRTLHIVDSSKPADADRSAADAHPRT